jgi:hypothetical protein
MSVQDHLVLRKPIEKVGTLVQEDLPWQKSVFAIHGHKWVLAYEDRLWVKYFTFSHL